MGPALHDAGNFISSLICFLSFKWLRSSIAKALTCMWWPFLACSFHTGYLEFHPKHNCFPLLCLIRSRRDRWTFCRHDGMQKYKHSIQKTVHRTVLIVHPRGWLLGAVACCRCSQHHVRVSYCILPTWEKSIVQFLLSIYCCWTIVRSGNHNLNHPKSGIVGT